MKRYLFDTSVLSLMAPGRADVSPTLGDWSRAHGDQLFISTITIAEVQQGIGKLQRNGGQARAQLLSEWLRDLIETGGDHIEAFDTRAALDAGEMSSAATAQERHPGFADVAIASVAQSRGMTLLTTNGGVSTRSGLTMTIRSRLIFLSIY